MKYWIEIVKAPRVGGHYWRIKARNGRVKATSHTYSKPCLCINDAQALADDRGFEIRMWGGR